MKNANEKYSKRKKCYEKLMEKQKQTMNFFSVLRFIIFFSGIGFTSYFYFKKLIYLSIASLIVSIIIFTFCMIKYNKIFFSRKYALALSNINDDSLKRLSEEWKSFKDIGEEFIDNEHNYSGDLDVFGIGSLFQWINCSVTYIGRYKLKEILTKIPRSTEEIYKRQEAIEELGKKIAWRQRFIAEGIVFFNEMYHTEELFKWSERKNNSYLKFWFVFIMRALPTLTILSIFIYFITNAIPYTLPLLMLAIQLAILMPHNIRRGNILNEVYVHKKNIKAYSKMLDKIENTKFKSEYINSLKNNLKNDKEHTACKQIKDLVKISEFISDRNNFFYIVFNIIFLWDYQCIIALEKWKEESGDCLKKWIETIGEIEALASLSIINFDNPTWAMPVIKEAGFGVRGKDVGHPLLTGKRVCNDMAIGNPASILLITGSNMSGKSTYLRTSGINLILAYSGTKVCAGTFQCSIMSIYTCMRISDNLEKGISSFYAEIIRIKKIVKALEEEKNIFVLLDEIFKGTNSSDRHTGAKILISKLKEKNVLGMVSTHDLELSELEKESNGKIKNYNFREYYENNKIYFDYKLHEGVSTTKNALYLMKMAGIEI